MKPRYSTFLIGLLLLCSLPMFASAQGRAPTVYTGGQIYLSSGWDLTACYWKGTTRVDLPVPGAVNAGVAGITVQGSYVLCAGSYSTSGQNATPCYWVNGMKTDLSAGSELSGVTGITVESGVVYCSGYYITDKGNVACYWKGSSRVDMGEGIALAIAVSNGTVYCAGMITVTTNGGAAQITAPSEWVDGRRVALEVSSDFRGGSAGAIYVRAGDVYIGGADTGAPCYWHSGKKTNIWAAHPGDVMISSIDVYDGTVYLGGYYQANQSWNPCFLKGMTDGMDFRDVGIISGDVVAMKVWNGTVYCAGNFHDYRGQGIPSYTINEKIVPIVAATERAMVYCMWLQ